MPKKQLNASWLWPLCRLPGVWYLNTPQFYLLLLFQLSSFHLICFPPIPHTFHLTHFVSSPIYRPFHLLQNWIFYSSKLNLIYIKLIYHSILKMMKTWPLSSLSWCIPNTTIIRIPLLPHIPNQTYINCTLYNTKGCHQACNKSTHIYVSIFCLWIESSGMGP